MVKRRAQCLTLSDKKLEFLYWRGEKFWVGYLQQYPDSWTQGTDLADLKAHLKSLYWDITHWSDR